MLPVNAYVALEVEHVLIFRKGNIRKFNGEEITRRAESALLFNERNSWYQAIWNDIKGVKQKISNISRERNAAYAVDLPYRLIKMFSIKGDWVWDPFGGTGTTTIAAIKTNRNSIINDIEYSFVNHTISRIKVFDYKASNKALINYVKNNFNNEFELEHELGTVRTKHEQKIKYELIKNIEFDKDKKEFKIYYEYLLKNLL